MATTALSQGGGDNFAIVELLDHIPEKCFRYDITGFVEELSPMPEIRYYHICASLPDTGVRPANPC